MTKRTFRYCATHKEDEAYMQKMCAQGWAATRLVEGFWTFEPCEPNQYCYRVCYLRGMKKQEIEELKTHYAAHGIQFVSQYSFWAIFRSTEPFALYTDNREKEICKKIYAPMPIGAAISWLVAVVSLLLVQRVSAYFWLLTLLATLYASMCTWLAISYRKLLKTLS